MSDNAAVPCPIRPITVGLPVIVLMGGNRINHADSESGNRIGYVNADVGYPRTNAGIYVAVDKVRADGIGQQIVGIVKGDDIQTADDPPIVIASVRTGSKRRFCR